MTLCKSVKYKLGAEIMPTQRKHLFLTYTQKKEKEKGKKDIICKGRDPV